MSKAISKSLKLLLVVVLLKSIVWSLLVPLWHFPDEQAHFGHIAYLVENPNKVLGKAKDLTEEIAISEKLLGTFRDEHGNNNFTYHPEYNLEYTSSLTGKYEAEIKSLPISTRSNFVAKESAYYPHFFYQISSWIYKAFYNSNLFIRVFTIRLFWLFLYLMTLYLTFLITELIFSKKSLLPLVTAVMVGFHPMFNFVSSGISSDNLHNFLFSAMIYFSLKLLLKPNIITWLGLLTVMGLGLVNIPQFFIAFAVVLPVFFFILLRYAKKAIRYFNFHPFLLIMAFIFDFKYTKDLIRIFFQGKLPYFTLTQSSKQFLLPNYSLIDHLTLTIKHTIREVIPWYWGVFKWLGVVLPRWVNRVLNRLVLVAFMGIIIKFFKLIKKRQILKHQGLIFITYIVFIYFSALLIWDWGFFRNHNFSFGIQGRYYFPVIIPHMILLSLGVKEIFGLFGKIAAKLSLYILSLWFIVLNFIALYTILNSYYDTSSFKTFIIQASQYKPFFAKGWWLASSLVLYLAASLSLLWCLGKLVIKGIKHEK